MTEELVPVTAELILAGQSNLGGWTRDQLAILGIPWPPPVGWKVTAIGRLIRQSEADRFVSGRRANQEASLFDPPESVVE